MRWWIRGLNLISMSMNIFGLVIKKEHFSKNEIEKSLKIKLKDSRSELWELCQSGIYEDDEIMIISNNSGHLLYFPIDFFDKRDKAIENLLGTTERGVVFAMSEISMYFQFQRYKEKNYVGMTLYSFEGDFEIEGDNFMNLSEEDDVIIDGFFPLLEEYIGKTSDEESIDIFRFIYS